MAEGKAVYIVSVSYGYVLAHQTKGSPSQTVVQARVEDDDLQKWFIERTEEEGVVAIRNAKTGSYINCSEQKCWGKIKCDENRQLWQYDSPDFVHPPGAVRLQPKGFGKVFMNHHGPGRPKKGDAGVAAHMWDWVYDFNTTWYFQTTDAMDGSAMLAAATAGVSGKGGEDLEAKVKDIEAREAALAAEKSKQEDDLKAQQKKIQEKEAELAKAEKVQKALAQEKSKQQDDLQEQQKKIRDKEAELAETEKTLKDNLETKQRDLADREAALAQREKDAATGNSKQGAKGADFATKLKDLQAREQALAVKEKKDAAEKEENLKDLQKREHDLQEREKKLAAKQAAAAKQPASSDAKASQSKPQATNGTKDDQQIKELQDRLDRLEKQLASTQPPQQKPSASRPPATAPSAHRPATTKPTNSLRPIKKPPTTKPTTSVPSASRPTQTKPPTGHTHNDKCSSHVHTASCGHPLRLPPRKLDRKVVGMIYEA